MNANITLTTWKSGNGFSYTEGIESITVSKILSSDEFKSMILDGEFYADGWTDADHDGHLWKLNILTDDGDDIAETVEAWVYPEDVTDGTTVKYSIIRDSFEAHGRYDNGLDVQDILDLDNDRNVMYPETEASFDDLDTAKKAFEQYKSLACTRRRGGGRGTYIEVVYYELISEVLDEDGDPVQQLETIAAAIEPLPAIDED